VHLHASLKDDYLEQGAVLLKRAFAPEALELLARGIERNLTQPSETAFHQIKAKPAEGAFIYDYGCHAWIPEYCEFAVSTGLAEAAAQLMSSQRVCFFDDSYMLKQAGATVPSPWHHDWPYYEIDGEILVAWIPLDSHGKDETLRMVAGSHRWGKVFAPASFNPSLPPNDVALKYHDPLPDIDAGNFEILAWEVEPGDCVFFHGLTLHGSHGNSTLKDQRRFSCRFVDESAVYSPRPGYSLGDGKANAALEPLCA
jgi:ectoine hydroxylase-related dioxygenase (phytanoyl-CoA dioxygenase family)